MKITSIVMKKLKREVAVDVWVKLIWFLKVMAETKEKYYVEIHIIFWLETQKGKIRLVHPEQKSSDDRDHVQGKDDETNEVVNEARRCRNDQIVSALVTKTKRLEPNNKADPGEIDDKGKTEIGPIFQIHGKVIEGQPSDIRIQDRM